MLDIIKSNFKVKIILQTIVCQFLANPTVYAMGTNSKSCESFFSEGALILDRDHLSRFAVVDPVLSKEQHFLNIIPIFNHSEAIAFMQKFDSPAMHRRFAEAGWPSEYYLKVEHWPRVATAIRHNLQIPSSQWVYHGTSIDVLGSIRKYGLNNMLGKEVQSGGMLRVDGVTYLGDIGLAKAYAKSTANIRSSKPMLIRFQLEEPVSINAFGASRSRAPEELWYSVDDGVTWYPISIDVP